MRLQCRLPSRPRALPIQGRKQRHPRRHVIVAKPARGLLHIGLEMENGVAVLGVTRTSCFGELLDDVVRFPKEKLWQDLLMQSLEQFTIAHDMAAIKQRNRELYVLRIELF